MSEKDRAFWMAFRQALIIMLGAIEDRLGLPRSIVPRRKRRPVDMGERIS